MKKTLYTDGPKDGVWKFSKKKIPSIEVFLLILNIGMISTIASLEQSLMEWSILALLLLILVIQINHFLSFVNITIDQDKTINLYQKKLASSTKLLGIKVNNLTYADTTGEIKLVFSGSGTIFRLKHSSSNKSLFELYLWMKK